MGLVLGDRFKICKSSVINLFYFLLLFLRKLLLKRFKHPKRITLQGMSMQEEIEKQIEQVQERLDNGKREVENIKNEFISKLKEILPCYLEKKIGEVMERNADKVLDTEEHELREMRTQLNEIIPQDVQDIISKLSSSEDWFKCRENEELFSRGVELDSEIWRIIESIDEPITKILSGHGIETHRDSFTHRSEISPVNWSWFDSEIFKQLNSKLVEAKKSYCGYLKQLEDLKAKLKRQKAGEKWRKTAT